jgi:LysM repeat protein
VPDEGRKAARVVQDREQELAALRAETAAAKIAAAKKEAELIDLRTLVSQLRQENGEVRQAALEWQRLADARQSELTALQTEREQWLQAKTRAATELSPFAELKHTVETLSRELNELKQTMATTSVRAGDPRASAAAQTRTQAKPKRQVTTAERAAHVQPDESPNRVMPVVHVLREDGGLSKPSRVTVQPGDTLWGIAKRHRTTVKALRALNGLAGDQVLVGKDLKLP